MSIADVMSRIAAIQSQISQFSPPTPAGALDVSSAGGASSAGLSSALNTSTGSSTSQQSGTDFAAALAQAKGSTADTAAPGSLTTTSSISSATNPGSAVVADAQKYLGVPYLWGGTNPTIGLDCSGLVQRVYGDLGVTMPRVAADQATMGVAVPNLASAQPGDLVAFNSPIDHIGIYMGNGNMIVAPHAGANVEVEPVSGMGAPPTAIRRILSPGATSGLSALAVPGASTGLSALTVPGASTGLSALTVPGASSGLSALAVPGASTGLSALAVPGASTGAALSNTADLSTATGALTSATGRPAGLGEASYAQTFTDAGAVNGVPPALLSAVAKAESGYNPTAVSPAGAQGLMQFMPGTAAGMGVNPWDPTSAINGAAKLLASNYQQFGSWSLAVAAYNAGGGAVQSYGGIPPYPETQNYVANVLSYAGMGANQ